MFHVRSYILRQKLSFQFKKNDSNINNIVTTITYTTNNYLFVII